MYLNRKYKIIKFLYKIMSKKDKDMELLFEILGSMKGIPQKYGQFLYLKNQEEYSAFEKLLDDGIEYSNEEMLNIIDQKIGSNQLEIDEYSLSSASIGQVYEGNLNDKKVIVKVQYPSIKKSLFHDVNFIKRVIKFFFVIFRFPKGSRKIILEYLNEFEKDFSEETDYTIEEENLLELKNIFINDKKIEIPGVFTEYTDETIIVEEKCSGIPLREFLRNSSEKEKREIINIMFRFYFESFFNHNILHGDAHTGNFFVKKEDNELILQVVDFGCVKYYDNSFVSSLKNIIYDLKENREEKLYNNLLQLGFNKEDLSSYGSALIPLFRVIFEPFLFDEPFDFEYWRLNYKLNKIMGSKISNEALMLPKELVIMIRVFQGLLAHISYLEKETLNLYKYVFE